MQSVERLNRDYMNYCFLLLAGVNLAAGQVSIPVAAQLFLNAALCIYVGAWWGM